jgi:hypothetical protein
LAEHHLLLLSVYESKEQNDSSTKLSLFGAAAVLAGELEKSQELPLHLDFVGRVFPAGDGPFEHRANDPQNGDPDPDLAVSNIQQAWLRNESVRIKKGSATNKRMAVRFFSDVPSQKREGDRNSTFSML